MTQKQGKLFESSNVPDEAGEGKISQAARAQAPAPLDPRYGAFLLECEIQALDRAYDFYAKAYGTKQAQQGLARLITASRDEFPLVYQSFRHATNGSIIYTDGSVEEHLDAAARDIANSKAAAPIPSVPATAESSAEAATTVESTDTLPVPTQVAGTTVGMIDVGFIGLELARLPIPRTSDNICAACNMDHKAWDRSFLSATALATELNKHLERTQEGRQVLDGLGRSNRITAHMVYNFMCGITTPIISRWERASGRPGYEYYPASGTATALVAVDTSTSSVVMFDRLLATEAVARLCAWWWRKKGDTAITVHGRPADMTAVRYNFGQAATRMGEYVKQGRTCPALIRDKLLAPETREYNASV